MITLSRAMVLAAGLGTRMRPLSEAMPKPLLPLAGRSLLDHALDRLMDAGVTDAVVNAHWLADQVAAGVNARSACCTRLPSWPSTESGRSSGFCVTK